MSQIAIYAEIVGDTVVKYLRAFHYYDYQIYHANNDPIPIHIHRIGHSDYGEAGNNFATFEDAQAEVFRRVVLRQQTGLCL